MTDEVRERRFAPFVRLEANESMDPEMVDMLVRPLPNAPLPACH